MEKILAKLKTNSVITLILGILSLTWLFVDYFVFETIVREGLTEFSLEWILLIISGIVFLFFIVAVFINLFYIFRLTMKHNSELKKKEQESQSLAEPGTVYDEKEA